MKLIWPAVLLAWIAGFVDSLGYLALAKVFTAHMSGNAAAVGAELGSGNWHKAMIRGLVIPEFVFGVAVGSLGEALMRRSGSRAQLAPAFLVEVVLLSVFIWLGPYQGRPMPAPGSLGYFFRTWLLAVAMGVQSATLRQAGGQRVRTTFISGMLTNMTESALHGLVRRRGEKPGVLRRRALMFGAIFLSFMAGGICGGFSEVRWGAIALVAPIAALLFLAIEDGVRPIRQRTMSP